MLFMIVNFIGHYFESNSKNSFINPALIKRNKYVSIVDG